MKARVFVELIEGILYFNRSEKEEGQEEEEEVILVVFVRSTSTDDL